MCHSVVKKGSPASLLLQFTTFNSRTRCLCSSVSTRLLHALLPLLIHPLPPLHFLPFLAWITLCILQGSAQHHLFQEMLPEASDCAENPSWVFSPETVYIYSLLLLRYIDILWLYICLQYKIYILAPKAMLCTFLKLNQLLLN